MCLVVSVDQEPGHSCLGSLAQVLTPCGDQGVGQGHGHLKAWPGQNCFLLAGLARSISKVTHVALDKPDILTVFLEGDIISSPHGLLHNRTACFSQSKISKPEKVQNGKQDGNYSLFVKSNVGLFIPFVLFLFLTIESLGPAHTQGETII